MLKYIKDDNGQVLLKDEGVKRKQGIVFHSLYNETLLVRDRNVEDFDGQCLSNNEHRHVKIESEEVLKIIKENEKRHSRRPRPNPNHGVVVLREEGVK